MLPFIAMSRAPSPTISPEVAAAVRAAIETKGARATARDIGVHHSTLAKAAKGGRIDPTVANKIAALAKTPPRVREAVEFKESVQVTLRSPTPRQSTYSWSIESIRAARDEQMRGHFALPVQLAEASQADDAVFVARNNRLAPQACITAELVAAEGARGETLKRKAADSCFAPRTVIASLLGTMVDHGIAVGYIERETNKSGTRVDFRLTEWPLEFVRWNHSTRRLETSTAGGQVVEIVHGNGVWLTIKKYAEKPWAREACIVPGALIWASHAEGMGDWAAGARAHGLAQIMGELPDGTSLADAEGNLSPQAQKFLELLRDVASGEAGAGIRPFGSKVDFVSNNSTAWQIFKEIILSREKAAARVYQGTDAALGAAGGAPGVDIATLFGVATTKIQGDFEAIEAALSTGFYQPWAAINAGTSQYAPRLVYQIPDPDAASKRAERATGYDQLINTVKGMREQKLAVTQETVVSLAHHFGVSPVPQLAASDRSNSTLVLAPTSLDSCVLGIEARASQGLPPFGDERDFMTITLLKALDAAKADMLVKAAPAAPAAP